MCTRTYCVRACVPISMRAKSRNSHAHTKSQHSGVEFWVHRARACWLQLGSLCLGDGDGDCNIVRNQLMLHEDVNMSDWSSIATVVQPAVPGVGLPTSLAGLTPSSPAMPPKAQSEQFLRMQLQKLSEISVAMDSGWRGVDEDRVTELEQLILDGNYGSTSLAPPSLIAENDKVLLPSVDGGLCLNNGKQMIAALQRVEKTYQSMSPAEREEAPWLVASLVTVFTEGLQLGVYQFPGPYDRLQHQSIQALSHEGDQNKLFNTTLSDKAKLARAYYHREGQDWTKAKDALMGVLGQQKASTINRWIIIARDFNSEVLQHIALHKDVQQNFIVGNPYLVGKGAETRFRLGVAWAKVAFEWYLARKEAGRTISSDEFISDFCLPAKHAESWERAQLKIYGVVASSFRAFSRVVEKLQSEQGRRNILAWIHDKEVRKQHHFGLEELQVVTAEMQKMKAGTNISNLSAAEEGSPSDAGLSAPRRVDGEAVGTEGHEAVGSEECEELLEAEPTVAVPAELEDLVAAKAKELADTDLMHVTFHSSEESWAADVKSNVFPSSKPIVYVECPTSRASVFHNFLKLADKFPPQFSLYIPLGNRLDMLSGLSATLKKKWLARPTYAIQLSVGRQSTRIKPSYALYMPMEADQDKSAATHVSLEGCRAVAAEGIRLRCVCKNCPLRAVKPTSSTARSEQEEIPVEDQEEPNFEECFEQGEDEEEADALMDGTAVGLSTQSDPNDGTYVVNLFPYAAPIAAHARIFADVLKATQRTHLLLLTRTAHPGVIIAAREANLKVTCLQQGVAQHASAHGSILLKKVLAMRKLGIARGMVVQPSPEKRAREPSLQFITVEAPIEQPVHVKEIEPSTSWRGGLNKYPKDMEDKLLKELHQELGVYELRLQKIDGAVHVVTSKPLREGDVVCPMAGLTFDSADRLRAFLDADGINKSLATSLIRIDSVHLDDETPPTKGPLFRVCTGVSRFVRHYHPTRKAPNTALTVDTSAGCDDKLVFLTVRTRNRCGVAQGTPLVLNYGLEYDHEVATKFASEPNAKRLRGLLDTYFAKLGADGAGLPPVNREELRKTEEAEEEGQSKKQEEAQTKQEQEEAKRQEKEAKAKQEEEEEERKKQEAEEEGKEKQEEAKRKEEDAKRKQEEERKRKEEDAHRKQEEERRAKWPEG